MKEEPQPLMASYRKAINVLMEAESPADGGRELKQEE